MYRNMITRVSKSSQKKKKKKKKELGVLLASVMSKRYVQFA